MYGAPPQKLRTPEPIKPPKDLPADPVVVNYRDTCDFGTTRTGKVVRQTSAANTATQKGDEKVADYDKATSEKAKSGLIVDGIDHYLAALKNDPFNAQATLKLALAYDKVRRKGCALALLQRLDQLAQNPKFEKEANDAIDEILQSNNRTWFGGYRADAVRAVGHPGHP
jgi:hypothetical protein